MVYVFNTCRDFIRTMPDLVYSNKNPEDINTDGEDHIYDETRYMFMDRPIIQNQSKVNITYRKFDPLSDQ